MSCNANELICDRFSWCFLIKCTNLDPHTSSRLAGEKKQATQLIKTSVHFRPLNISLLNITALKNSLKEPVVAGFKRGLSNKMHDLFYTNILH